MGEKVYRIKTEEELRGEFGGLGRNVPGYFNPTMCKYCGKLLLESERVGGCWRISDSTITWGGDHWVISKEMVVPVN